MTNSPVVVRTDRRYLSLAPILLACLAITNGPFSAVPVWAQHARTPVVVEERPLSSPYPSADALFGAAVSIDGDTAVVSSVDGLRIFERWRVGAHPLRWRHVATITTATSGQISGDTVIGYSVETQTIRVFERDKGHANRWRQVAVLPVWGAAAISGDTIAVLPFVQARSGVVHVFERDASGRNAWGEVAQVPTVPEDHAQFERFWTGVAIDGDTVLVSVIGGDSGGFSSVVVLERQRGKTRRATPTWNFVTELPAAFGTFAIGMTVSGDTVAISSGENRHLVYIHERNAGGRNAWGRVKELPIDCCFVPPTVALDRDTLVVGALESSLSDTSATLLVFDRDYGGRNAWGQIGSFAIDAESYAEVPSLGGYRALPVAVSGDVVLAGAYREDIADTTDAGLVHVYRRTTSRR